MDTTQQLNELYKAFDYFNKELFSNKLPKVIIVLQRGARDLCYGYFTPAKTWEIGEEIKKEKRHEISISTEFLSRSNLETLGTLLHEMIHLYNHINNIKDVSRQGRYHNKRFLESAKRFGMLEDGKHEKYGYSVKPTMENKAMREMVERFDNIKFNTLSRENPFSFTLGKGKNDNENAEEEKEKEVIKRISYNFTCSNCNENFKFTTPGTFKINEVVCNNCGEVINIKDKI